MVIRRKKRTTGQLGRKNLQPLSDVPAGSKVRIAELSGGRGLRDRCISMGLNRGRRIEVVRANHGHFGPAFVKFNGTRLGVGYGMASKILVESDPA